MYNYLKNTKLTYSIQPDNYIKFLVDSADKMDVVPVNDAKIEWSEQLLSFFKTIKDTVAKQKTYIPTDIIEDVEEDSDEIVSFV